MPLKELEKNLALMNDPSLATFDTVEKLAQNYLETKAYAGNALRPPGDGASEQERQDFYAKVQKHAPHLVPLKDGDAVAEKILWSKLGRPEKPEEYVAAVPEGLDISVDQLRSAAFEAGMTKVQFGKWVTKAVAGAQERAGRSAAELQALRTEWGAAYDQKIQAAAAAAAKFGVDQETVAGILAGKVSPVAIRRWAAIGAAVPGERNQLDPASAGNPGALTRDEAERQFQEIQRNPAYTKNSDPDHDRLVARAKVLMKMLHPD